MTDEQIAAVLAGAVQTREEGRSMEDNYGGSYQRLLVDQPARATVTEGVIILDGDNDDFYAVPLVIARLRKAFADAGVQL